MATFPSSSFENKSFLPLVTSTTEPMGNCLSSVTSFNEVSSWFTKIICFYEKKWRPLTFSLSVNFSFLIIFLFE